MACKEHCEATCLSYPRCNGCAAYKVNWAEMIKDGYDPVPSMYPRTMIKPLRGLRTHVTIVDEFAEYSRADVEMTMKLYKIIKNKKAKESMRKIPFIKNVIFNDPATIVFWTDDTKTVVKCQNEKFDPEKGLAMAIAKKALGNEHDYYAKNLDKWVGGQLKKDEPEKPKRMTFREEVAIKEPHRIDKYAGGGVLGCPRGAHTYEHCQSTTCRQCWDREIPEEKPAEDSVLRVGDKAVKVHGENDDIDHHPLGAVLDVESADDKCECVSTLGPTNRRPNDKIQQHTYRTCLKKLAKDQTFRPGDKLVVVKEPSYGCAYNIGDVIIYKRKIRTSSILTTKNGKFPGYEQILKADEVVKIVD